MAHRTPLLPSPQLLSSPMLPSSSNIDYFQHSKGDPQKRGPFRLNTKKRAWQPSSEDDAFENARHAYLTPDPSSQVGFSSPPRTRHPLSSIPLLRPKVSGEPITIGRSSVQCTHPIPQQSLNLQISRVHVILTFVPETREISVQCKGVNPIYINTSYETIKLDKGGELHFKEGEDFKINIAGYVVIVEAPELSTDDFSDAPLPTFEPPMDSETFIEPQKKRIHEILPSSPPRMVSESPMPQVPERTESPCSIMEKRSPPPASQLQEIEIYHDASVSPPPSSLSPPPDVLSSPRASQTPDPTPSNTAVLDALLTTLIFAEVKPTPLPRLVADLTHRVHNVHEDQIKAVLTETPCVGIVRRSGKDAAGKELSDEYYYIAESTVFINPLTTDDENEQRKERYYQFARPTRSCRLKHSQYHWRPVKLHSKAQKSAPSSPGKENVGGRRKKVKREHHTDANDANVIEFE